VQFQVVPAFPSSPTPMRIPCTCGCGFQVTHATKINHLNGRGKTSLRARVLEENQLLKPSTSQQPVLLRDDRKKKRSHPSSNQIGNRKRLKVAQLEVDQIPETSPREDAESMGSIFSLVPNEESEILSAQAYTDPTESPTPAPNQVPELPIQTYTDPTESPPTPAPNQIPEIPPAQARADITESPPTPIPNQAPDCSPVFQADTGLEDLPPVPKPNSGIEDDSADALSSARRSSRISERTREITEQRWGNSRLRDDIQRSDCGGGSYRSEDEEDVDLIMTGDEDSDDEDNDDDGDDNLFAESDVTGISAWDLLGEDFEREVASIGMFLSHESSVLLTNV
jgi:hypothetical protein